jgi:3-methyladenine DNA glycosylase AlkD
MKSIGTAVEARRALRKAASAEKAKFLQKYFRTEKGGYGEGDIFLGLVAADLKRIAKEARGLSLGQTTDLLRSKFHEERSLALEIWTLQYSKADEATREKIVKAYLKDRKYLNNWDLIDGSAPKIFGKHLMGRDRSILYQFAVSKSLWERRISILTTHTFIRAGDFDDTIRIAKILLHDTHDLIHKAVGWMLREMGLRNEAKLEAFLERHAHEMPRTMLRYSLERLPPARRVFFMGRKAAREGISAAKKSSTKRPRVSTRKKQ